MDKFLKYHTENPSIYKKFKELTFTAINKGFEHYGAKGIFEQIRWESQENVKSDGFKVNNIYTPHYARLFAQEFPEHKNFFRTRESKKHLN